MAKNKEVKKITEEELTQIVDVQKIMTDIIQQLGIMEAEKHTLLKNLEVQRETQEQVKKVLEEKYGAVNIDLTDGAYTPIEVEAKEEK
jgi:Fe-S cluster assembly scaffold protein SufB